MYPPKLARSGAAICLPGWDPLIATLLRDRANRKEAVVTRLGCLAANVIGGVFAAHAAANASATAITGVVWRTVGAVVTARTTRCIAKNAYVRHAVNGLARVKAGSAIRIGITFGLTQRRAWQGTVGASAYAGFLVDPDTTIVVGCIIVVAVGIRRAWLGAIRTSAALVELGFQAGEVTFCQYPIDKGVDIACNTVLDILFVALSNITGSLEGIGRM